MMSAAARVGVFAMILLLAGHGWAAEPGLEPDASLAVVLGDPRFAPHVLKALEAREKGLVDEALDHLRQANNAIKRAKGANNPDQLPVLDLAAEILFDANRLDDAVTPLKRAVAIREGLVGRGQAGNHEVALASSLLLMGRAHSAKGRFDSGLEALTKAVRVLDDSLGHGHEATQRARRELAEAVAIFERTLGLDHPATLKAQRERVAVEVSVGDYAAAARVLDGMLEAERARQGDSAPAVLALTAELARAVQYAGRPEDAASLVEAAIERAQDAAASRAAVARCLRDLAEIQLADDAAHAAHEAASNALGIDAALGDEAKPAALLDRLLLLLAGDDAAAETAGSEEHLAQLSEQLLEYASQRREEAACGLRLAARASLAAGDAAAAAACVRSAAELDESLLGAAHPDTLADRLLLARSELAEGAAAEALERLEAAHREARAALGASHSTALAIAESIAECHTHLGRIDDAEKVVLALLSRDVPYAGRGLEARLVEVVDGVAAALESKAEPSRAAGLRDGLVAVRRRQFGPDDARVAETLAAFGRLRLAAKRWDDAIRFFEQSLAIRERSADPDHPDASAALLSLGKALRAAKRHEDARAALARASSIWNTTVGAGHPVACETLKLLALTELSLGRPAAALPLMERLLVAYDANPHTDPEDIARLLVKLAEVRTARGDVDIARGHLARALALRSASDAVVTAVDVADFAKRNRLADDEDGITIAGARQLADGAAQPDPGAGGAADSIRLAWDLHSAGQREAARELLRTQLGKLDGDRGGDGAPAADLLMALADMRERPLEIGPALDAYRRAASIRGQALGDLHPATIAAALRLAGAGVATGNTALARSTLAFAAGGPPPTADLAGPAAVARDVAGQTAVIAVAAEEPQLALDAIRARARLCERGDPAAQAEVLEMLEWPAVNAGQRDAVQAVQDSLAAAVEPGRFADSRGGRAVALARAAAATLRGDHEAAATLLDRLAAAEERAAGLGDPRLAADLLRLAAARERGAAGAADEPRIRAWGIIDRLQRGGLAADGTDDVDGFIDLAGVLVAAGDASRAERVLKAAVEALNAPGARKPVAAGRLLLELGDLQVAMRPQQASRSFAEALRIVRDAAGGGHGIAVAAALRLEAAARRAAELEEAALAGRRQGAALLAAGRRRVDTAELPTELAATAASAPALPLNAAAAPPPTPGPRPAQATASPTMPEAGEQPPPAPAGRSTAADATAAAQPRHQSQLAALVSSDALVTAGRGRSPQAAVRDPAAAAGAAVLSLPPLERAEALKRSADVAIVAGDVTTGLDSLRQLGALEWKLFGGDAPRVLETMLRYAELLRESGNLARASALAGRAAAAAAAGSPERAVAIVCQARLLRDAGDVPAAADLVAKAAREIGIDPAASGAQAATPLGGTTPPGEAALVAAVAVARAALDVGLPDVAAQVCDAVRRSAERKDLPESIAARNRVALVEAHLARGEAREAETDARWLLDRALEPAKPEPALVAARRVLLARVLAAAGSDEWKRQAAAATRGLVPLLAKATPEACPPPLVEAARQLAEVCIAGSDPPIARPLLEGLRHTALACLPAGHEQTAPALEAAAHLARAGGREDLSDALLEAAESATAIRRSGMPAAAESAKPPVDQAARVP